MPNLYEYFVTKALDINSNSGYICLITPDRLGYNDSLSYLRKRLLDKHIQEVIYRWDFPEVVVDTVTILIRNSKKDNYEAYIKYNPTYDFVRITKKELLNKEGYQFLAYRSQKVKSIVGKVKNFGVEIENIASSTSGFGGKSKLITDKKTDESQIPVLKGENIKRFYVTGEKYFEFIDENITGRTRDTNKLGKKHKVLIRKTGGEIISAIDKTGRFPEQSAYFLYDIDSDISLEYLVAVLNSKLINWYYLNELVTNIDSTPQLKKSDLDSIPIVEIEPNQQKVFSNKISLILTAKKEKPEADTSKLEAEIDRLVYELYGLSEEEIGIVEGSV